MKNLFEESILPYLWNSKSWQSSPQNAFHKSSFPLTSTRDFELHILSISFLSPSFSLCINVLYPPTLSKRCSAHGASSLLFSSFSISLLSRLRHASIHKPHNKLKILGNLMILTTFQNHLDCRVRTLFCSEPSSKEWR